MLILMPASATSGGRSRSGFLVCLVVPETGEYSVLQWSSRRQTITAYSAPEAEIVAMSEGIMTSILTYDAAEFLGVCVGCSSVIEDSDVDRQRHWPETIEESVYCCQESTSYQELQLSAGCVLWDTTSSTVHRTFISAG